MKVLELFREIWYNVYEKNNMEDYRIMDAISLSHYVVKLFNEKNENVTNLKLQKVLYYIQGYFYKEFGKPAFFEEIRCWPYGPVVPISYYEFNSSGSAPLKSKRNIKLIVNRREEQLIQKIVCKCIKIPSFKLVEQTHGEDPWHNAKIGDIISKESIVTYFRRKDPLKIS